MIQRRSHEKYDALIQSCQGLTPMLTIIVHPCDEPSLSGAIEAAVAHIINPVLVGPEVRIRTLAASLHLDLTGLRIVNAPHSHAAAEKAVALVRAGEGDARHRSYLESCVLAAGRSAQQLLTTAGSHGLRNEMHFCGSGVFAGSFNAPIFCGQGIANTSAFCKWERSEERSQAKSLLRYTSLCNPWALLRW